MLTKEDLELLESVQSSSEWRVACDTVKSRHGGQYPSDWWTVMKLSGKMDEILARFGQDSRIKISGVPVND